jgi:hypothetical protein
MDVAGVGGKILNGAREMTVLAVVEAYGANVLLAAPCQLRLLLAPALHQDSRQGGERSNQHSGGHENDQQQDHSGLSAPWSDARGEEMPSCAADVGKLTNGIWSRAATTFVMSILLPPPAPMRNSA